MLLGCLIALTASYGRADPIKGDTELLRQAGYAIKQNLSGIQTWQGQADQTADSYEIADPAADLKPAESYSQQATFAVDRVRDLARVDVVACERVTKVQPAGGRKASPNFPETAKIHLFSRTIRQNNGESCRYTGDLQNEQNGQLTRELSDDTRIDYFDPTRCMFTNPDKGPADCSEWLIGMADVAHQESGGKSEPRRTVKHTGDLVTFLIEAEDPPLVNRYTFDLAKGGNLVEYHSENGLIKTEITVAYGKAGEYWIPVEHVLKNVHKAKENDPGETLVKRIVLREQKVNEPLDPSLFTVQSLGVKAGNYVLDKRLPSTPIIYKYSGTNGTPQEALDDTVSLLATQPAVGDQSDVQGRAKTRIPGSSVGPAQSSKPLHTREIVLLVTAVALLGILLISIRAHRGQENKS